ncbi:hypothetical protein KUCAC02_033938 [Chaenocephalus aceratus]|nr:hypothetical protein KUCAC02_033938 [Chaenocephalus aceratus]
MLLTCALQEGGLTGHQAPPPQPIREKSYTLGRSYDTSSGMVVTMVTTENRREDVIAGRPLITICEGKTPPCDIICDVTGGGRASAIAPLSSHLSPSPSPGHLTGRVTPPAVRVVCWSAWKQA